MCKLLCAVNRFQGLVLDLQRQSARQVTCAIYRTWTVNTTQGALSSGNNIKNLPICGLLQSAGKYQGHQFILPSYCHTFSNKMADNKYACDYAKLGTSGCKKCKQKLAKGELRIAKLSANPFGDGDMKIYHHPKCIFETFIRARASTKIIESLDDIEGHEKLEDEDKDLINGLIKGK